MYSFYRVFSQFDFSKLLRASCHALFEKEKEVHIVNTHIQLSKTFAQYCMGFGAYLIYSFCRQFCMDLCLPVSSFCCHVYLIAWLPFVLSRGKKKTLVKNWVNAGTAAQRARKTLKRSYSTKKLAVLCDICWICPSLHRTSSCILAISV